MILYTYMCTQMHMWLENLVLYVSMLYHLSAGYIGNNTDWMVHESGPPNVRIQDITNSGVLAVTVNQETRSNII